MNEAPSNTGFSARVYWAASGAGFDETRATGAVAPLGMHRQRLTFRIAGPVARLRLDPAEQPGYFHLYRMVLRDGDSGGELWALDGGRAIAQAATAENVRFCVSPVGEVFVSSNDDPQLVFELPESATAVRTLSLEVELDWPMSNDFVIARDGFVRELEAVGARMRELEQRLERAEIDARELAMVKRSRVWRLAEAFRRLFYVALLGRLPVLQRLLLTMSREGLGAAFSRRTQSVAVPTGRSERADDFDRWLAAHPVTAQTLEAQRARAAEFAHRPKISILMPVYNVPSEWLRRAVASVEAQSYGNWELCIVDDASTSADTRDALGRIHGPRITIRWLKQNCGIAAATNATLKLATGEYIGLLDHDDELTPDALYEVVAAINAHDPDLIYSDEDFLDLEGRRANPHFKPDFSPDLLLSHNYVTHFVVLRRALFERIGGFDSRYDGAQDYDLVLRATEATAAIHHIPKILYHWRMSAASTSFDADSKPGAQAASRRALTDALARRGVRAEVLDANLPHFFRVRRAIEDEPLVSILIPFKDQPELLKQCIGSVLERSTWRNYEIVGVSNNSVRSETFALMAELAARDARVRFEEYDVPFNFSRIVNHAAARARGAHLVLLNNDIEVISWDWLEAMLEHSQRPEVGAVGAKLYYPDDTVQHAGIIVGLGGYAAHSHKHFRNDAFGYINRLNVIQNLSAMTGACLMVKKALYQALGGLDEDQFGVAYNDVDFCLRAREQGLFNVFTPYAELYHHESLSRGYEDTPEKRARFEVEKAHFARRHRAILERGDPYYSPHLTLDREDFGIRC